jgi:hypothetical protein
MSSWSRVILPSSVPALCNLDCGPHGRCDSGKCRCDPGWTGPRCEQLPCDPRCQEHGQCRNGTCVCSQGWNGRHCTLRKYFVQVGTLSARIMCLRSGTNLLIAHSFRIPILTRSLYLNVEINTFSSYNYHFSVLHETRLAFALIACARAD